MKREKYTTVITYFFMTIEAMLMGLTILLFTSLSGSIENLMKTAETPDFLQMHNSDTTRFIRYRYRISLLTFAATLTAPTWPSPE